MINDLPVYPVRLNNSAGQTFLFLVIEAAYGGQRDNGRSPKAE
jgi:hypothetical protein